MFNQLIYFRFFCFLEYFCRPDRIDIFWLVSSTSRTDDYIFVVINTVLPFFFDYLYRQLLFDIQNQWIILNKWRLYIFLTRRTEACIFLALPAFFAGCTPFIYRSSWNYQKYIQKPVSQRCQFPHRKPYQFTLVVIKNSNFFPLKSVSHLAAFPVYIFRTILPVNNSSILIKGGLF